MNYKIQLKNMNDKNKISQLKEIYAIIITDEEIDLIGKININGEFEYF